MTMKAAGEHNQIFQHLKRVRSGTDYTFQEQANYFGKTNYVTGSLTIRNRIEVFTVRDRLKELNYNDIWTIDKITMEEHQTLLAVRRITGDTPIEEESD